MINHICIYVVIVLAVLRQTYQRLPDDTNDELDFITIDGSSDVYDSLSDTDDLRRDTPYAPIFRTVNTKEIIDGQYNVLLKSSIYNRQDFDSLISSLDDDQQILQVFDSPVIHGFTAKLSKPAVRQLRKDPMVKLIEADAVVYEFGSNLVACKRSTGSGWAVERITHRDNKTSGVYLPTNPGKNVYIYILDTGVKSDHLEFGGRVVKGKSFVDNETTTEDVRGHGTCAAGCAAGKKLGIAKDAYIVPVKVMAKDGRGANSKVIAGLTWAVEEILKNKQKGIINMSLGGSRSTIINNVIGTVYSKGVPVIVAAGNSAIDASTVSPASAASAFTVGASDKSNNFAKFSNKGSSVKLNAPGVEITCPGLKSVSDERTRSGTSFSSPYTAGVAAILYSQGVEPKKIYSEIIRLATKKSLNKLPRNTPNLLLYSGCNESLKTSKNNRIC